MSILSLLFPKNYNNDNRPVPDYHTASQMASTKNSAVGYLDRSGKYNRTHGNCDVEKFRDERLDAEQDAVRRDWSRQERLAHEAEWDNAKYYADHPQELRHVNSWEQPSDKVLQAAKDYRAKK